MRDTVWLLRCALVGLLLITPAWAWNREAHQTVALVAEQRFSPDLKSWIVETLRYHPYLNARSYSQAPGWPDQVRSDPRYHHGSWHFVNLPVWLDDQERSIPITGDALMALNRCTKTLKDPSAKRPDKAVALCWVIHLVGDIHQPLHAANAYSADFPKGDGGGGRFMVVMGQKTIKLHAFWDSAGGLFWHGANSKRLDAIVDSLMLTPPSDSAVADQNPLHWLEESHRLAEDSAYRAVAPNTPLTPEYIERARDICAQRMTLGGYRLADYLERLHQASHAPQNSYRLYCPAQSVGRT